MQILKLKRPNIDNLTRLASMRKKSEGFTLVELMIATAIFSTILLLATTGVINIGKLYYKGITTTRTQETARSIMDDVSKSVQLTGGEIKSYNVVPSEYQAMCIGKDRYTYAIDRQVNTVTRGLWLDETEEGSKCKPYDFTDPVAEGNDGKELLGTNMRLLDFSVTDDIHDRTKVNIKVGVAYGDNDLLTHYDDSGNLIPSASPADAQCKPTNSGGSFCAVSTLETFVKRRHP